jgi:1-acyl-sn-glycerol-3-phosphate acyltransferase
MSSPLHTTVIPAMKALGLATWTTGLLGIANVHTRLQSESQRDAVFDVYVRRWARGVLLAMQANVCQRGTVLPQKAKARLVVANHRSAADIPVLLHLFGGSVLSRADLANWPIIGRSARAAQTIFVDREDPASRLRAIREIRACLERGRTVSLFPEGATHAGDDVRPFAAGSLVALRGLDVEVVPVGLAYPAGTEFTQDSFVDHARDLGRRTSLPIGVAIGDSIAAEGVGGEGRFRSSEVATFLQSQVQTLVLRAREAIADT